MGRVLHSSSAPTVEFRASIVIGSGGASYEIVRALVEQLPVAVAPRWIETAAQPIAVEDVVEDLIAALGHPGGAISESEARAGVATPTSSANTPVSADCAGACFARRAA